MSGLFRDAEMMREKQKKKEEAAKLALLQKAS